MRLDLYLTHHHFYKSRARAVQAIAAGCVKVNDTVILKNAFLVPEDATVVCLPDPVPYVSRGGLKLAGAIRHFQLDVRDLDCLDIGSSTGGFTHVLLENGASHITCVDVGHGQMDPRLARHPQISLFEDTDGRYFRPGKQFDFICMDVSFISVTQLGETVKCLLKPTGQAVILVKPQFELGRKALNKQGIVKSKDACLTCLKEIIQYFTQQIGFQLAGSMESPIRGGDGNIEYCIWLKPLV